MLPALPALTRIAARELGSDQRPISIAVFLHKESELFVFHGVEARALWFSGIGHHAELSSFRFERKPIIAQKI
jgi:hypothetical protein